MSREHLYKERIESTLNQVKFKNGGDNIGVNRYDLELYVKEFKRLEKLEQEFNKMLDSVDSIN